MGFKENLVIARKKRGLTQDALGKKLGITAQAISQWESGESVPDAIRAGRIAKELGVSADWLLGEKDDLADDEWAVWQSFSPAARRQALRIVKTLSE